MCFFSINQSVSRHNIMVLLPYVSQLSNVTSQFKDIYGLHVGVQLVMKTVDITGACVESKNMLAMYLKYHKAGLTPTTPVTSIAISSVKMSIGRKSPTNLRSEMIFLQGKPVFYIFLPSTPPY
jgi:hypothetical protein